MKLIRPNIRFPLALLAVVLLCGCAADEGDLSTRQAPHAVEIVAAVDKASANPGDIITFTLSADHSKEVRVDLPEVADRFSDFRIVNSGLSEPFRRDGRLAMERWYKLQADVAGSYVIEPVEVAYQLEDGVRKTARTPKIFIEIKSLLEPEGGAQDIRDIKPPLSVSPSLKNLLPIAVAAAAAASLILFCRWLYGKYLRRKAEAGTAGKSAHEEAIEALEKLLLERLMEKGRVQEFCFKLSLIFRRYLEARFHFPAVDFTREEILRRVNERDGLFDGELKQILADFLADTDLVKFAKHRPPSSDIENLVEATITFIGKTAPAACAETARSDMGEEAHEHVPV
jgi:hypothetical protein